MIEFYEEKGAGRSVLLQAAPSLGSGYLELIVLDEEGVPTARTSGFCSRPRREEAPQTGPLRTSASRCGHLRPHRGLVQSNYLASHAGDKPYTGWRRQPMLAESHPAESGG